VSRNATYADGTPIAVGDRVLIEHGRTPGIVEHVIVQDEDVSLWDVGEPGLMLLSEPFGRVFWPLGDEQDPVRFVDRGLPFQRDLQVTKAL
jgi:hypothetical protein